MARRFPVVRNTTLVASGLSALLLFSCGQDDSANQPAYGLPDASSTASGNDGTSVPPDASADDDVVGSPPIVVEDRGGAGPDSGSSMTADDDGAAGALSGAGGSNGSGAVSGSGGGSGLGGVAGSVGTMTELDAGAMDAGALDAGVDASVPDASLVDGGAGTGAEPDGGKGTGGSASNGGAGGGGAQGGSGGAAQGGSAQGGAGGATTRPCDGECGTTDPILGELPRQCCADRCVNPYNDPYNCGGCGIECASNQICQNGGCVATSCQTFCAVGQCCGFQCCTGGDICCDPMSSLGGVRCVAPSATGTCPLGCAPLCECVSPGTLIATASGEVPIEQLQVGDLVYSVDDDAIVLVPLVKAEHRPVENHHVRRLTLNDGTVLEISEGHPMGDGTAFGSLHVGDVRDTLSVVAVERIPYQHEFTYDILPDSSTGTYFAGGLLIGSTLFEH